MHRLNVSPMFPPALVRAGLVAVAIVAWAAASNMSYQDDKREAALACEMVKAGKWPADMCEQGQ